MYVHPSYYEGFPNSLLEAMASGIPSIGTNVGSIPELIVDQQTGFIIEPGDVKKLEKTFEVIN